MSKRYASDTSVPIERSQAGIKVMLQKRGAIRFGMMESTENGREYAIVSFVMPQHAGENLAVRIHLPLPSKADTDIRWTDTGKERTGDALDVDRAWAYFVCSWIGRNGVAGTHNYNAGFCKRFTKNGGHGAKRFASAVDSIPAWRRRMRNVTILREDAIGLIDRIEDAEGVVIYCDPPYLRKGAKYLHDFESDDHARLAEALRRFKKTRVVVSYYDEPELDELYPGWGRIDCSMSKALSNQGMRDRKGSATAPEILLLNHGETQAMLNLNAAAAAMLAERGEGDPR